ncbi:50S ribosomal protein L13, partial [Candidatus Micrarchaeota archaeon CG11_big_fil_rev_8_21_14_0_20_47_5]
KPNQKNQKAESEMVVIDAKDVILGRMCAKAAKLLLLGKTVSMVNAEQAAMSGKLFVAKEKYLHRLTQKHKADPNRSPKWPKEPAMLVKRILRGMLPYRSQRGRDAYKRLRIYEGVPPELENAKKIRYDDFDASRQDRRFSILSLCRELGFNG